MLGQYCGSIVCCSKTCLSGLCAWFPGTQNLETLGLCRNVGSVFCVLLRCPRAQVPCIVLVLNRLPGGPQGMKEGLWWSWSPVVSDSSMPLYWILHKNPEAQSAESFQLNTWRLAHQRGQGSTVCLSHGLALDSSSIWLLICTCVMCFVTNKSRKVFLWVL